MTVIEMLIFCIAVDFNRYYKQSRDEENNFSKDQNYQINFPYLPSQVDFNWCWWGVKTKNAGIAIISSSSPHYGYGRGHFLLSYL